MALPVVLVVLVVPVVPAVPGYAAARAASASTSCWSFPRKSRNLPSSAAVAALALQGCTPLASMSRLRSASLADC